MNKIDNTLNEIEDLKKELWYLLNKIIPEIKENSSVALIKSLKDSITQLQTQLEEVESQTNLIKANVEKNGEDILVLQNDISTTNDNLENLQIEVDSTNLNISQIQENIENVSINITNLQKNVENTDKTVTAAKNDLLTVNKNFTEFKEKIQGDLNSTNENLSTFTTQITNEINAVSTQIADLALNVKDLEEKNNSKISELTIKINNLSSSLLLFKSETNERFNSVESDITSITTDLSSAKTNISNNQKDIASLRNDITLVSNSINDVNNNLSSHESQCTNSISSLNSQIETMGNDIEEIKNTIENLGSVGGGSSGGEVWETIYDIEDSSKTYNFPDGMPPSSKITNCPDLFQYQELRVQLRMSERIFQQIIRIKPGYFSYCTFLTVSDIGSDFYMIRVYVHKTNPNLFVVSNVSRWTISSSEGTVEWTVNNTTANFRVIKFEGRK